MFFKMCFFGTHYELEMAVDQTSICLDLVCSIFVGIFFVLILNWRTNGKSSNIYHISHFQRKLKRKSQKTVNISGWIKAKSHKTKYYLTLKMGLTALLLQNPIHHDNPIMMRNFVTLLPCQLAFHCFLPKRMHPNSSLLFDQRLTHVILMPSLWLRPIHTLFKKMLCWKQLSSAKYNTCWVHHFLHSSQLKMEGH